MWIIYCFLVGLIEKILILFKIIYNLICYLLNLIFSINIKKKINKKINNINNNEFNLIDEINNCEIKDISGFNDEQQIIFKNLIIKYKNVPMKLILLYVDKFFIWDSYKLDKLLQLIEKENIR